MKPLSKDPPSSSTKTFLIRPDPGSHGAKGWFRIRVTCMRIRNTGRRKHANLAEGEDAVVHAVARLAEGLLELLLERGGRVQEVNLAVLFGGGHLCSGKA